MEDFAQFLADKFYYVFLGVLGVYVVVKIKNRHSSNKRKVYFTVAVGVFFIYTGAILPIQGILPFAFIPVLLVAVTAGVIYLIKRSWPFRLKCAGCGAKLDYMTVLADDRNLCGACLTAHEEKIAPAVPEPETEPEVENPSRDNEIT